MSWVQISLRLESRWVNSNGQMSFNLQPRIWVNFTYLDNGETESTEAKNCDRLLWFHFDVIENGSPTRSDSTTWRENAERKLIKIFSQNIFYESLSYWTFCGTFPTFQNDWQLGSKFIFDIQSVNHKAILWNVCWCFVYFWGLPIHFDPSLALGSLVCFIPSKSRPKTTS